MTCDWADETIIEYAQQLLAPAEHRRLNHHIRVCPECQIRLKEIRAVENILATRPLPEITQRRVEEIKAQAHSLTITEAGWLAYSTGEVRELQSGAKDWQELKQGEALYRGSTIETGEKSKVYVKLNNGSELWLNERSIMHISSKTIRQLGLRLGELLAFVKPDRETFFILCPSGKIEAQGTLFNVIQRGKEETVITVLSGKVRYTNPGGEALITAAQTLTVRGVEKPGKPVPLKDYPPFGWAREVNFGTRRQHLKGKKVKAGADEEIDWRRLIKAAGWGALIGPAVIFVLISLGLIVNILSNGLWGIGLPGRSFGWLRLADDYLTLLFVYPLVLGVLLGAHLGAIIALLIKKK